MTGFLIAEKSGAGYRLTNSSIHMLRYRNFSASNILKLLVNPSLPLTFRAAYHLLSERRGS
jgi:hypothetical protein